MTYQKVKPIPIIENELYDDEELFWWGQPTGWHFIRGQDIASIGTGLITAAVGAGFYLFTRNMFFSVSFSTMPTIDFVSLMFTIVPLMFILNGIAPLGSVIFRWMTQKRTY